MKRRNGRTRPEEGKLVVFARRMASLSVLLALDGVFLCATVFFAGAGAVALVAAVAAALIAAGARLAALIGGVPSHWTHVPRPAPVHHHEGLLTRV